MTSFHFGNCVDQRSRDRPLSRNSFITLVAARTFFCNFLLVVDSAYYALNRLSALAPLEVYESSLTFAVVCGPVHHELLFKALVHQLFHVPNICITFHLQLYPQHGAPVDAYQSIALSTNIPTECSGANEAEAMDCLGNQNIDTNRGKYWHPDFPGFSVIFDGHQDGVLYLDDCGDGT